ncbi:MAG: hypothetical protein QXL18_01635 [Candidatus Woesearchaeota archaeon]
MTKKVSRDEESYYVSIKSPLETRRQLLECTKKSIISLKNYHKMILIRKEKLKHLEDLRQSIKELSFLYNKLSQMLPDYNTEILNSFRSTHKDVVKKETQKEKKESKKTEAVTQEHSELHKLESALAALEEKIKSLE